MMQNDAKNAKSEVNFLGQFIRFAGIGGVCTALQYLILILLVKLFDVYPVTASTIGYIISALLNYQLNRVYTFLSDAGHSYALPRFFAIAFAGLLLNAAVLGCMHSFLGMHYILSQIVATAITLIWNFIANRTWTFSETKVNPETSK